jgi:hypothetical protein
MDRRASEVNADASELCVYPFVRNRMGFLGLQRVVHERTNGQDDEKNPVHIQVFVLAL